MVFRSPSAEIAVDIFMVASGFLMVYQYRRREAVEPMDSWRTAVRFWLRRFFRIAPVSGLTTLQQAAPERWSKPSIYSPPHCPVDFLNTLVHASFLFGLLPKYASSNLTPDWSIGLEMQFYAVFPFLFFVFRKSSWVVVGITVVALSAGCNRWFAHLPGVVPGTFGLFPEPSFLLMKLPLFFIGMLCGEVFCRLQQSPGRCALMSVGALLLSSRYSLWVSVAVAVILWQAWSRLAEGEGGPTRIRRWLDEMLSNRCAAFMADASYCVYLTHGLFISFVGGYLFRQSGFLTLSPPMRVGILTAVVCSASYLLAWILHHILEKPGIELGRRLTNRWLPPAPGMTATGPRHYGASEAVMAK